MVTGKSGIALLLLLLMAVVQSAAADTEATWKALQAGGHVVLLRHAVTEPGVGDPPGFVLGACRTQRNLSAQGRRDAIRIGEAFRRRGIPVSDVLSSRWCRCLDTARLAFGRATPAAMLDSMFVDDENAISEKIREVHAMLARRRTSGNLILVTHNRNIQALTGISPSSGEMVVARAGADGALEVVGRLDATQTR